MNLDFPFQFDSRGRTASADDAGHIRDMIEQFLFTNPSERVNRPDFGGGLLARVFAPNGEEQATALQFKIQADLQRWLGDVVSVHKMEVTGRDATLTVDVAYILRRTGQMTSTSFTKEIGNGI